MKIDYEKAIEYLLYEKYLKEFKIIDGINQHKDGLAYSEWLEKKGLYEDK